MSYDLMVFAPNAAPEEREAFIGWYAEITTWDAGLDYYDPSNLTPELHAWYQDMLSIFPAMNGPQGISDDDANFESPYVTDYNCTKSAIYISFSWDVAQEAYECALSRAAIHNVGFFDVSAENGEVWLPGATGYSVAHGGNDDDRQTQLALAELLKSQR